MALRIMGPPAAQVEEGPASSLPNELLDQDLAEYTPTATEEGKVEPQVAVYRGAYLGPFKCGNCSFFREDNSCILVAGYIEAEGVCNLFTKKLKEEPELAEGLPIEEAPVPTIEAPPMG